MTLANFVSMCGCCSMTSSIAALFRTLTQGVYVIGVAHGEERNAFTAAWVMQVSFDPLLLALSINPNHSSYRLLKESGAFSVNVLKQDQLDLAARFGDPAREDRLAEGEWTFARLGLPVLREALAWFACEVQNECPAGDPSAGGGKGDRRRACGCSRPAAHLSRYRRYGWRRRTVPGSARQVICPLWIISGLASLVVPG